VSPWTTYDQWKTRAPDDEGPHDEREDEPEPAGDDERAEVEADEREGL